MFHQTVDVIKARLAAQKGKHSQFVEAVKLAAEKITDGADKKEIARVIMEMVAKSVASSNNKKA